MAKTELVNAGEKETMKGASGPLERQMTILGRGECGKTSIVHRLIRGTFAESLPATPIESELLDTVVQGTPIRIKIFDTSGQDDYSRFRVLTLPVTDYVLVCYSVIDTLSYAEVEDTIAGMIAQKAPAHAKVVLVATKIDCSQEGDLTAEEGRLLAERIGAIGFFECSALTGVGVNEIFNFVARDIHESAMPPKRGFFSRVFGCCG